MSNISKRRKEGSRTKIKTMGDHKEFLRRITKTLYYGQLPLIPSLSLPITEISCSLWSVSQRGRSLRRLHADAAAGIARGARVSPCALVLAMLYLERLNSCNPDYIAAAAPADLFLVSLMVGTKFLQDDGEDDDIFSSEWAASGGLELSQLKKLEVEFLDAIDWNVYVSKKSFEDGLSWLEKQVAMRQAQRHGFFTYTDLVLTSDGALFAELFKSVSAAWLALTLGYVTSLMTFVTSTLVISHAWLPTLHYIASRSSAASTVNTNVSYTCQVELPDYVNNDTLRLTENMLAEQVEATEKLKCCTKWLKYQEKITPKKNWYDTVIVNDWKFEPWWSKTSVLNWLYQSSLINPLQRWLEKINEYTDFIGHELVSVESAKHVGPCESFMQHVGSTEQRCIRQWLNFSKLSVLVSIVSDR